MAPRLQVIPQSHSCHPGDTIIASIEVICPRTKGHRAGVYVTSLTAQVFGTEKVDPNWVSSSFHADTPIHTKEGRRIARYIFRSEGTTPCAAHIRAGEKGSWHMSCPLPSVLPPSFHGTCAQYSYALVVTCTFTDIQPTNAPTTNTKPTLQSTDPNIAPWAGTKQSNLNGMTVSTGASTALTGEKVPLLSAEPNNLTLQQLTVRVSISVWPQASCCDGERASDSPDESTSVPVIRYALISPDAAPEITLQELGTQQHDDTAASERHKRVTSQRSHIRWAPNRAEPSDPSFMSIASDSSTTNSPTRSGPFTPISTLGGPRVDASTPIAEDSVLTPSDSVCATPVRGQRTGVTAWGEGHLSVSARRNSASFARSTSQRRSAEAACTPRVRTPQVTNAPAMNYTYGLRMHGNHLVRIELHSPREGSLRPGSTFSVTLDFRDMRDGAHAARQLVCHRVVLLLETEEQVQQELLLSAHRKSHRSAVRQLYEEVQEVSQDMLFTCFTFTIPRDASPCFRTQLVSLNWVLRFEFLAGKLSSDRWAKPEQLNWALPLIVRAPEGVLPAAF